MLSNFASQSPTQLPASGNDAFDIVTTDIVAPASLRCLVTSTVQTQPAGLLSNGVYFRNAVRRDGVNAEDGQYGMYLSNDGTGRKQPSVSRTSVLTISSGQTVAFGVYFGDIFVAPAWYNVPYAVTTSYICHQP